MGNMANRRHLAPHDSVVFFGSWPLLKKRRAPLASLTSKKFSARSLVLIAKASDFQDGREPPFRVGDVVRLNSGSPNGLIVDLNAETIIMAWRNAGTIAEAQLPVACVHRVRDFV